MRRPDGKRDYSRRSELQRLLGDLGYILPRQVSGTVERPAAGWYAKLANDDVVYLGDNVLLAGARIMQLKTEEVSNAPKLRSPRRRGNAKPARARQPGA